MTTPIRVVIVDDQQLVRAGFQRILETEPGIEVVRWRRPDVVLMDIQMPAMDGLEATRRILEPAADDAPRIIILTTFELDEYVFEAIRSGPASSWSKTPSRTSLCKPSAWWPAATPCCP